MKVYIVTEFSRTRQHGEVVENKRILSVYDNILDAQKMMRGEAAREIDVLPGVDYTECGTEYVETVKGKIVLDDPPTLGSHIEEEETWRWEIEEHDVEGTSLNNKTISATISAS